MAWRIDEAVIRGEIDNRVRGRVTGRIWFAGRAEPVELDLAGDGWRDLAGRRLEFANPVPKPADLQGLGARQTGTVGDITASRKVKVPEVSMDELMRLYEQRQPFPWHWGNSLYLEWFANGNGRVVIESASYQLTISPEIAWDMTPAEEAAQRRANAEAMGNFMPMLGEAVAADQAKKGEHLDATPPGWNEEPAGGEPPDEAEDHRREAGELAAQARPRHPLAERAFEAQIRFRREAERRGWAPPGATDEHPVADMVLSMREAARKFSGALNPHRSWPPAESVCDDVIERLRRARGHLNHASLAALYCEQEKLADAAWLAEVQREIDALAHACDQLTGELRAHWEREQE